MNQNMKVPKNYRLSLRTIGQLEELHDVSDKTATDLIEGAINYIHEEYVRALSGKKCDAGTLAQVLGVRM